MVITGVQADQHAPRLLADIQDGMTVALRDIGYVPLTELFGSIAAMGPKEGHAKIAIYVYFTPVFLYDLVARDRIRAST